MNVSLSWTDTNNIPGTTYNVYRAVYANSPVYEEIATGVIPKSFGDIPVPGSYVYYVTAVNSGVESSPSNTAYGVLPVVPPTNLTAVATA